MTSATCETYWLLEFNQSPNLFHLCFASYIPIWEIQIYCVDVPPKDFSCVRVSVFVIRALFGIQLPSYKISLGHFARRKHSLLFIKFSTELFGLYKLLVVVVVVSYHEDGQWAYVSGQSTDHERVWPGKVIGLFSSAVQCEREPLFSSAMQCGMCHLYLCVL